MKRTITLVMLLCIGAITVLAASGDALNPTNCTSLAPGDWANCDSTYASDDNYCSNVDVWQTFFWDTTFNAGVPDGATIDTIYFIIEGYGASTVAARRTVTMQTIRDGTKEGDAVVHELNQDTDQTDTVRGTTNSLWNLTWTVAQINDNGTGVSVGKNTSNAVGQYVDHIQMVVWYTEAGGGPDGRRRRVVITGGR